MQKYPQNKTNGSSVVRPVKQEGYCSDTLHAKRDRKRSEAQARQRERAARTDRQQYALCSERPGQSKREKRRLSVAMQASSQVIAG